MNKLQGYIDLPTAEGPKTMHFSMNFIFNLQEIVEEDVVTWLSKLDDLGDVDKAFATCQIIFSALAAYDMEEGNQIDYNVYKVRNWIFDALNDDPNTMTNILNTMTKSIENKMLGKKKANK